MAEVTVDGQRLRLLAGNRVHVANTFGSGRRLVGTNEGGKEVIMALDEEGYAVLEPGTSYTTRRRPGSGFTPAMLLLAVLVALLCVGIVSVQQQHHNSRAHSTIQPLPSSTPVSASLPPSTPMSTSTESLAIPMTSTDRHQSKLSQPSIAPTTARSTVLKGVNQSTSTANQSLVEELWRAVSTGKQDSQAAACQLQQILNSSDTSLLIALKKCAGSVMGLKACNCTSKFNEAFSLKTSFNSNDPLWMDAVGREIGNYSLVWAASRVTYNLRQYSESEKLLVFLLQTSPSGSDWYTYMTDLARTYRITNRFSEVANLLQDELFPVANDFIQTEADLFDWYNRYLVAVCNMPHTDSSLHEAIINAKVIRAAMGTDFRIVHNVGVLYMMQQAWPEANQAFVDAVQLWAFTYPQLPEYSWTSSCTDWVVVDWSTYGRGRSETLSAVRKPQVRSPKMKVIASSESKVFSAQVTPYLATTAADPCGGSQDCLYSMSFLEVEVVKAELHDAWLGQAFDQPNLYLHSDCQFHLMGRSQTKGPTYQPRKEELTNLSIVQLERGVFLHWLPSSYFHFTCDVLPKLLLLKESDATDVPIVLIDAPFVRQYLRMLQWPEDQVVYVEDRTRYHIAHLDVLDIRLDPARDEDPTDRLSLAPAFLLAKTRKALAPQRALGERDTLVYVRRGKDAFQRSVPDDSALVRQLDHLAQELALKFEIHHDNRPGSASEQIELFRSALVTVGPHGAGLSNALWMAEGSILVEFPVLPLQRTSYAVLASALGLHYWVVPEVNATQFSPMVLDKRGIKAVVHTVREAVVSVQSSVADNIMDQSNTYEHALDLLKTGPPTQDCILALKRIVQASPEDTDASCALGIALRFHSPKAAVSLLRRCLDSKEPFTTLGINIGAALNDAFSSMRSFTVEEWTLLPQVAELSGNASHLWVLGRLQTTTKNFTAAEAAFRQGLAMKPQKELANRFHENLAESLYMRGRWKAAAHHLLHVISESPKPSSLIILFTSILLKGSSPDQLVFEDTARVLQEARQADPTNRQLATVVGKHDLVFKPWSAANASLTAALTLALQQWPNKPKECSTWRTMDWANTPTASSHAQFGHQAKPKTRSCPEGSSNCMESLYPMKFAELDVHSIPLENAWVEAGGRVYFVHAGCSFHWTSVQQVCGFSGPVGLEGRAVQHVTRGIFLHWSASSFYTFVAEILPKLLWLRRQGMLVSSAGVNGYQVFIQPTSFIMGFLNLIEFKTEDVIWLSYDKRFQVDNLLLVDFRGQERYDRVTIAPSFLLKEVRQLMLTHATTAKTTYDQDLLLYAPRVSNAGSRGIPDDHRLRELMQRVAKAAGLKFEVHGDVQRSKPPPVVEQIAKFRRARILVGPHGGALTNAMWMQEGAALVEFPLWPIQRTEFATISAALGLDYWIITNFTASQFGSFPPVSDAAVEELEAVLGMILSPDLK